MDAETKSHLHETPAVVTVPLVMLAIPSAIAGWLTIGPVLFGDFFGDAIFVLPVHDGLSEIGQSFHGPAGFVLHAFASSPAVYLALAGAATAWYLWLKRPELPARIEARFSALNALLVNKYYADELYQKVFATGARGIGLGLWKLGDQGLIDGLAVNGSARTIGFFGSVLRRVQTGYLYHYAFAMVFGLTAMLLWILAG